MCVDQNQMLHSNVAQHKINVSVYCGAPYTMAVRNSTWLKHGRPGSVHRSHAAISRYKFHRTRSGRMIFLSVRLLDRLMALTILKTARVYFGLVGLVPSLVFAEPVLVIASFADRRESMGTPPPPVDN